MERERKKEGDCCRGGGREKWKPYGENNATSRGFTPGKEKNAGKKAVGATEREGGKRRNRQEESNHVSLPTPRRAQKKRVLKKHDRQQ